MRVSRFVIWGHPRPRPSRQGSSRASAWAILCGALREFYYLPALSFTARGLQKVMLSCSFWGCFPCVVLFGLVLLVLVVLALAFVALLVWRWLVVAVPGLCGLLLVRFLGQLSGASSCLVRGRVRLRLFVRGWSVSRSVCVLLFVRFLAWCGSFLFPLFASFSLGALSPFFSR